MSLNIFYISEVNKGPLSDVIAGNEDCILCSQVEELLALLRKTKGGIVFFDSYNEAEITGFIDIMQQENLENVFLVGLGEKSFSKAFRSRFESQIDLFTEEVCNSIEVKATIRSLNAALNTRKSEIQESTPVELTPGIILNQIPLTICWKDKDLKYIGCNPEFVKTFGLNSTQDVVGKHYKDFPFGELADKFEKVDREVLRTGKSKVNYEDRLIVNGQDYWFRRSALPIKNSRGEVELLVAVFEDMTSRRKAEESCARERNLLKAFIDNTPDLIYFKDVLGRFTHINEADARAMGAGSPEEVYGKTSYDFHPFAIADEIFKYEQQAIESGNVVENIIEKFYNSEHKLRWVSSTKIPLKDNDGNVTGLVGISRDITGQKIVERQLTREKDLLQTLMDCIPDQIYVKNRRLQYTKINLAKARELGVVNEDDVYGKTETEIHNTENRRLTEQEDSRALSSGVPVMNEIHEVHREDGTQAWYSTSRVPIVNESSGKTVGIVGISRDVTVEVEARQKLEFAIEKAEEANRAKSLFLANMSHEIRTPMNGVIGMSDILKRTNLSSEQEEYVDIIVKSGNNLLTIINDILDFSKIESGKLEIEKVSISLRSIIEDVADLFVFKASHKKLDLVTYVDSNIPEFIVGDPVRIRQILTNLVNNAIKFTEDGDILISAELKELKDNVFTISISVRDTGIGISEEGCSKLFKSFTQIDASTTRKYGGTGLGLAISKRLVEMMDGEIGVQSKVGEGSTFSFTVDYDKVDKEPSEEQMIKLDCSNMKILIVDDNKTNRYIFRKYFESWNCKHKSVDSGKEALEELERAVLANEAYSLALLDFQMPEMDGIQLAEKIKERPSISDTKLVLLSSVSNVLVKSEIKEKGFESYLNKPIKLVHLYNALAEVMQDKQNGEDTTGKSEFNIDLSDLKILIAEDNEINKRVAKLTLRGIASSIDIASDGKEAVEMYANGNYDLVLMDIQMPVMNGYESTMAIRKLEREGKTANHAVIFAMTANTMKEDIDYCMSIGMNDYLSKPFKANDVLELLDKYKV
ncbi:PAS domain-containing sensor histidine kinase [Puteibacter caeruleilacunae]|nr:PAS domain-containing sensor histidine kinase [Puteibacter caeruleilacunae]